MRRLGWVSCDGMEGLVMARMVGKQGDEAHAVWVRGTTWVEWPGKEGLTAVQLW